MSESFTLSARVLPATIEADWTYPWITVCGTKKLSELSLTRWQRFIFTEDVKSHDLHVIPSRVRQKGSEGTSWVRMSESGRLL